MAKTNFDKYVEKRGKSSSAESRAAREVFSQAYVLASALMQARKASGLTQIALAEKSGVQQADISRMENGSMIPTMNTFLKLMDALEVTVTLKIGEKPKKKNSGRLMVEVADSLLDQFNPNTKTIRAISAARTGRVHKSINSKELLVKL